MAKQVIKYKNREEWLQGRSKGIGASEAGTVLGLNPWETPYQLWRRKKGIDPPKVENFAMKAGHYLEDAVSKFYADESHCQIIKASTDDFTILDPDCPILRVSPDRTFWRLNAKHNDAEKSILECKTTQMTIDPNDVPKHWFCQLQMNLGVGEYKDGALAWLTMGREFGFLDVDFDPDFFGWMKGEIKEYWERYIIGNEIPTATTADDVLLKFSRHSAGKEIMATEEIIEQINRLKDIKEQSKLFEKEQKEIEGNLKLFFEDAESIVDAGGKTLATWKSPKPSMTFDKKRFESENPELYNSYCKESQGARRLLVK